MAIYHCNKSEVQKLQGPSWHKKWIKLPKNREYFGIFVGMNYQKVLPNYTSWHTNIQANSSSSPNLLTKEQLKSIYCKLFSEEDGKIIL
ncbi:hypothetical protein [Candidatus Tisiphia endosymbiont of Oplodontha viridula]|uniref:hypothetical protein n=1 Tax=Candidatus Tisiphia endosymbiont of Oplodontha viridula TaxID=3077925 RepID=UPI0035C8A9CC